ncbi:hypothetical protein V6N13_090786 [Hibiscus sabdariffa]
MLNTQHRNYSVVCKSALVFVFCLLVILFIVFPVPPSILYVVTDALSLNGVLVCIHGFLDEQFKQLRDENNPDFLVETVSLFFEDSERLLHELTKALEQHSIDFKRVDAHVHQLKGSSSSIGAPRVKNSCTAVCEEQNVEGLDEQQIVSAGGSIPMEELSS